MAHSFAYALLQWHSDNPRSLPWADGEKDPYRIWLSEIIMQQTRIAQGTSYYLRFVEEFPTLQDLSNASLDKVLSLWEGLGYYTRARNLHKAAHYITDQLQNKFPDTYDGLLALPGIGPYSAAAISSFAFNHAHAVVDGNVKRVIARYHGICESVDDQKTHQKIQKITQKHLTGVRADEFNQAIMNFGALVCKPKPLCNICPLSTTCYAFRNEMTTSLPVKSIKKLKLSRYFHFIVIHHRGKILLVRREHNDIWKGLYVPPVTELASTRAPSGKHLDSLIKEYVGHSNFERLHSTDPVRQQLTHQTIFGRFHHIRLLHLPEKHKDPYAWVSKKTIGQFGKPKMVADLVL